MTHLIRLILFCYICFVVFLLFDFGEAKQNVSLTTHHRQRRYLSFLNVSRFFLRLNFKANMVPWNQIFAQALGFRINWDDPPDTFHPYHHLYRRTVYNSLQILLDRNGMNGLHCVRRAICEVRSITFPQGIYQKILKIIFRRQSLATNIWHNTTAEECEESLNTCPFSVLGVSLYTDLS